jgi:peptidoglycan/LPS O-acetylase OafA/YrhL
MRSTTGEHWLALDHIRCLAAFMVFTWHFTHCENGHPIPFAGAPCVFPFAILDEGHTGVSLFMTLSGYLFAKLLNGRSVAYVPFFWNRFLRLAPLLVLVIFAADAVQAVTTGHLDFYQNVRSFVAGFVKPVWPNGGWSITVEIHFYLILPLLMMLSRRFALAPLLGVAIALMVRTALYCALGQVQGPAYWTILGHIDQFLLGIFAFQHRQILVGRHWVAALTVLSFTVAYYAFDKAGGFFGIGGYPSPSPVWIILPTLEGAAYSVLIAYYDTSFKPRNVGLSGIVGKAGAYSYSIYLLHFFIVFQAAEFIDRHIIRLSNFYVACAWSMVCFSMMIPIGYLSFRFIESPFLRMRRRYIREIPRSELG